MGRGLDRVFGPCTVAGWCGLLLAVAGFTLSPVTGAQAAVSVTAEISSQQVGLGEPLEYTLTVLGAGRKVAAPNLPDLPGMTVAGSGSSTMFQSINGQISRSAVFSYTLIPEQVGQYTIPAVTVTVQGVDYASNVLRVEVLPVSNRSRAQPPQSGARYPYGGGGIREGDVSIDTTVDNPTPYAGEQVILTFSFDRAVELSRVAYTPAEHTGFRAVELDFPPGGDKHDYFKDGRRRIVQERKMALFPMRPGLAEIGPASIDFSVTPFSGGQRLLTEPIAVQVQPLPAAGRPDDFSGLVGQAGLAATLTPETGKVGDSLTLTLTVTGRGNLHDVTAPLVADSADFQVYAPEESERLSHGLNGVSGSRSFRYVIIPRRAGDLTLDGVSLSLFDPKKRDYRTVSAGPFEVTVAPPPAAAPTAIQANVGVADGAHVEGTEAAPVKNRGLLQNLAGWLQGMALFALLLLIRRWYRRRSGQGAVPSDPGDDLSDHLAATVSPLVATLTAAPVPKADMAATESALVAALALSDDAACLTALSHVLHGGIGACLRVPAGQVDVALIGVKLAHDAGLRDQVEALLSDLDRARFAPGMGGIERNETGARIHQALTQLMQAFPTSAEGA